MAFRTGGLGRHGDAAALFCVGRLLSSDDGRRKVWGDSGRGFGIGRPAFFRGTLRDFAVPFRFFAVGDFVYSFVFPVCRPFYCSVPCLFGGGDRCGVASVRGADCLGLLYGGVRAVGSQECRRGHICLKIIMAVVVYDAAIGQANAGSPYKEPFRGNPIKAERYRGMMKQEVLA